MPRIVRVRLNGQERDAIEVDFAIKEEQWNRYTLLDGGEVRLKTTAVKIRRILDDEGNPAYSPEGEPLLQVAHNTIITSVD